MALFASAPAPQCPWSRSPGLIGIRRLLLSPYAATACLRIASAVVDAISSFGARADDRQGVDSSCVGRCDLCVRPSNGTGIFIELPTPNVRGRPLNQVQRHILSVVSLRLDDGVRLRTVVTWDEYGTYFRDIPHVYVMFPPNVMTRPVYIVVERIRGLSLPHRLLITLTLHEGIPGQPDTLELEANMRYLIGRGVSVSSCVEVPRDSPRTLKTLRSSLVTMMSRTTTSSRWSSSVVACTILGDGMLYESAVRFKGHVMTPHALDVGRQGTQK
ncbi:hypothetical protein C8Q79DRAFT_924241 [Trametes meyenii]|nr:hypothetical protein C8Q79DRAFT_924241 [Trametes meyenii]